MDKEYWSFFINNFIKEKYKERLNYEFESVKKRDKAMGRFCHNAIEILRKDKIIYSSKKLYCFTKDQLKQEVLIVNMTNHIQGLICLLDEALEIAEKEYMATLIIGKDFIYVKEEVSSSDWNIYVLQN